MRTIMVLNAKGGCGKSTLITNLASYYATKGQTVALADFDVQASSLQWLAARPAECAPIHGVAAVDGALRLPRDCKVALLDTPAAVHGRHVGELVRRAQSIVMPVLPSPMDIRAAAHFVRDLF